MKYFTTVSRRIQGEWVPAGTEVDPSGWRRGALEKMLSRGVIAVDTEGGAPGSKKSIEVDEGDLQLVGDEDNPGPDKVYGTDENGEKGWKDDPSGGVDDTGNTLGGDADTSDEVAVHSTSVSSNSGSVAIGLNSTATGARGVAVGRDTEASGSNSFAAGWRAKARATESVLIGYEAESLSSSANGVGSIAIGSRSEAGRRYSVAIGSRASARPDSIFGESVVAIGESAKSGPSDGVVAVGGKAEANEDYGVSLGYEAKSLHQESVAIGHGAETTAQSQVVIGARHLELLNVGTPDQPGETAARLAVRDNDGTQELVVVFGNGTVKVITDDS